MPKGASSWKGSGGSAAGGSGAPPRGGSKKWVVKGGEEGAPTPAPAEPSAAMAAPSEATAEEDEEITSPILLAPSVGPVYDRIHLLRYFELVKGEKDTVSDKPTEAVEDMEAFGRKVSLKERPVEEEKDGTKTPQPAWKEVREKKKADRQLTKSGTASLEEDQGSVQTQESPGKRISLSQELPTEAQLSPDLAAGFYSYLSSMYGAAPMPPMYSSPGFTTVMLRNIPNRYTRDMLIERLNQGYRDQFDFVYLPIDFNSKCNVGYAFINFRSPDQARRFLGEFHLQRTKNVLPGFSSSKICEVTYARVQGREANMENLRDEKFIEKLIERPEWQPLFLDESGTEVPFAKTLGVGRKTSVTHTDSLGAMMPPYLPTGSPLGYMMQPPLGFGLPPFGPTPAAALQGPNLKSVLPHASSSTMVMLRGVPVEMTREALVTRLNKDWQGTFDFLYLPRNELGEGNRGFAFVNFRLEEKAQEFMKSSFNGGKPTECYGMGEEDAKACEVVAARMLSIDKNIDRLRASVAKTRESKQKTEWYPVLLGPTGEVMSYPLDTASSAMAGVPSTPRGKGRGRSRGGDGSKDAAALGKGVPSSPPMSPLPAAGPFGFPGAYPPAAYPCGHPSMPMVHPAYAVAMQQAAHAHARAAATHHAGSSSIGHQRLQTGLLDPLAAAVNPVPGKPLEEEQKAALKAQIEFYFSVDNLCKDLYLRSHMNASGWTPIELIAQFPQVRKFKASANDIVEILMDSDVLEVDAATHYMRLKDEELCNKWAKVPNEYRQSFPTKKKAPGSAPATVAAAPPAAG